MSKKNGKKKLPQSDRVKKKRSDLKTRLHTRNKHRERYDFELLIEGYDKLSNFVIRNKYNDESIDFSDPDAVIALNKALLKQYYKIEYWDIPAGYLCPPIPGRADYIHHISDLLAKQNFGKIPRGDKVICLDIGVGANCVYPIIGVSEYGWSFIGTDIDTVSIDSAKKIIESNPVLKENVDLRQQENPHNIFIDVLTKNEKIDLAICNPPFHSSQEEADSAANRKIRNLKLDTKSKPVLNFGGQNTELWCKGGELKFVQDMIIQSKKIGSSCMWFSTLISKYTNLKKVYSSLKNINASSVETLPMGQGNKSSRVVAWTFLNQEERAVWSKERWK